MNSDIKISDEKYIENNIEKYVSNYLEDNPEDCGYRYIFNESSLIEFVSKMIELSEKEEKVFVMKLYAIYAGIGNGFGGETFRCFALHENADDALDYARELAIDDYESYDSTHGLLSKEECEEEGIEYIDEVESWIQYSTDEVYYEDIISISEEECLDLDCICDALDKLNICIKIKKAMEAR